MGIGNMGGVWLKAARELEDIDTVAYVEIDDAITRKQVAAYDLDPQRIFRTLPEALAACETDAVVSIIPPDFRVATMRTCAAHRLPLLTEKPLAPDMAAARRMVDIATESGVLCMVAQNYRYMETIQTLERLLDGGELGRVGSITVEHYRGQRRALFHERMAYPLLQDMSIHHFDLLRFFLGNNPLRIFGHAWSARWNPYQGKRSAFALFEFPDAVQVSYSASWSSNGQQTTWPGNWRFECEHGVVTLRDDVITVQMDQGNGDHAYRYLPPRRVPHVKMPHSSQAYLLDIFRRAVMSGAEVPTPCRDNIHSLQMVFDVIAASESGEEIHREAG